MMVAAALLLCAAASPDERFLAGLRERGLYELAETYCVQQLADASLTPRRRAELTAELARTLSDAAAASPPAQREGRWQRATAVVEEYLQRSPDSSWKLLVEYQAALNELAHGELLRLETEVSDGDWSRFEPARARLRTAGRRLEQLRDHVAELSQAGISQPPEADNRADRPSRDELLALRHDIDYQLARVRRNQAAGYPPGSDDRAHALNEAIAALNPLARLDATHPLCWPSRVELARTYRLQADRRMAGRVLDAIESANPPPRVALDVRAERIHLSLDEGVADAGATGVPPVPEEALALTQLGREIDDATSPRLDLAWLEVFLTAWQASAARGDPAAARQWQDRATAIERTIERVHGPYWSRRAGLLLAEQVRAAPSTVGGDVRLLIEAADDLFRSGRLDDAAAGYDRAAEAAAERGDAVTAFTAAHKAAAIAHRHEDHRQAARQFRALAMRWAEDPRAAEAHRLALHHAGRRLADAAPDARESALEDYAAMLREHLRQWPNDEGADRLRLQLGRLQHGQGRHDEAITTLSAVSADFAGRNEVLSELRDCYARVEDDWVATAQQRSTLAELANRYPDDGPIQEAYARSLAAGDEPELWRGALRQYRIVETRSPEGSPRWFRAKYAIAQLHLRLGDPAKAAKIVRLTQLLHPELGGPAMRDRFEQLLARSQR